MAKRLDPRAMTEKYLARAGSAGADYVKGIDAVTEAPGAKAVRKQSKLKANFIAAVDSGKWAERTGGVSLEAWKEDAKTKGGANYAQGVAQSARKRQEFDEQFAAFLTSHMAKLEGMSDDTDAAREQKMLENVRGLKKFRFKPSRR